MSRSDHHRVACGRCGQEFAGVPINTPQYCDACQRTIYRHRIRHQAVSADD